MSRREAQAKTYSSQSQQYKTEEEEESRVGLQNTARPRKAKKAAGEYISNGRVRGDGTRGGAGGGVGARALLHGDADRNKQNAEIER